MTLRLLLDGTESEESAALCCGESSGE